MLPHADSLSEEFLGPLRVLYLGQSLMGLSDVAVTERAQTQLTDCAVVENLRNSILYYSS